MEHNGQGQAHTRKQEWGWGLNPAWCLQGPATGHKQGATTQTLSTVGALLGPTTPAWLPWGFRVSSVRAS